MRVGEPCQRFHAGTFFAVSNIIVGVMVIAGMVAVDLLVVVPALAHMSTSADRLGAIGGMAMSLIGVLLGLGWLTLGANAARPVLLDAERLYLPVINLRSGVSHLAVPRREIAGVEMAYRSAARNGRWQLSVIRLHGSSLGCDSLTTLRSSTSKIRDTHAAQVADQLRCALRTISPS